MEENKKKFDKLAYNEVQIRKNEESSHCFVQQIYFLFISLESSLDSFSLPKNFIIVMFINNYYF